MAVVLGVVTVVLSLVPVAQGWRTASQEGVPLSLPEYFSFPVVEGSPETVTYARPEGQDLQLDVWRPSGQGDTARPARRPAVVTVHGGGGVQGGRSEEAGWGQWLTEQGYVVFSIDYRLGPARSQEATGDVKCALGWVQEHAGRYGVDPDRIALLGHSFGGHVALLAAYTAGDRRLPPSCDVPDTGVAAVAGFYAPTDFTGTEEWPWWKPSLMNWIGDTTSDYDESEAQSRLTSSVSHVDPGDPPTILAQGGLDQFVPPEQSVLLANRLVQAGVPYRLLELPWARHGFDIAWGSWDAQIARHELAAFLGHRLADQGSGRSVEPR